MEWNAIEWFSLTISRMVRPSLSVELTRPFPALLKKGIVAKLSCQNGSVGCYSMYVESINGKQFCLIKHIRQSVCVHVWLHYHKLFFTVRHNRNARSCLVVVPQNVHTSVRVCVHHVCSPRTGPLSLYARHLSWRCAACLLCLPTAEILN